MALGVFVGRAAGVLHGFGFRVGQCVLSYSWRRRSLGRVGAGRASWSFGPLNLPASLSSDPRHMIPSPVPTTMAFRPYPTQNHRFNGPLLWGCSVEQTPKPDQNTELGFFCQGPARQSACFDVFPSEGSV